MSEPITVSPAEAMRLSGLGQTKLYELLSTGEIASRKLGRRRLIIYASLRDRLLGSDHASNPAQ